MLVNIRVFECIYLLLCITYVHVRYTYAFENKLIFPYPYVHMLFLYALKL